MNKQRLFEKYDKEVKPFFKKEFGIKNSMALPKVAKVVINMGIGETIKNKETKESLSKDLALITGQKPSIRLARVSVAAFGLRAGMPVGLTVTLRGEKMYAFLDRLFSIVLPRLRDFRGLSKSSFDKSGNFTLGLTEHTVFPEVDSTKSAAHGLEITIVVKNGSLDHSEKLLTLLGLPLERNN